ncbi:MAG: hypothetical protein WC142_03385 [Bacteroidales bacterium]|jgi:hypothetical protein|nr:hypothetical protein [Bacteroidales bacterium]MDD2687582.1 hypothetical protein [Bacteroidales bacterium]MDD3330719.1 hypothetical protein [Bacteroidales bacterium]MDD3690927.1 hypothetical protein [Bacteroidales bacterium]MDD4045293.1 hypothetical protein [Bacteroidales bacterium]
MRKSVVVLTSIILIFASSACKKEVKLSFTGDIMLDLGSSDQDVLKYVSASDGSSVSVSGINFDLVGEQKATFKTGEVSETKSVKIKADKLAGLYEISVYQLYGNEEIELTSGQGWFITLAKGNQYNQIHIPDSIDNGLRIFKNPGKLVVNFNGKDSAYIPSYTGAFLFTLEKDAVYSFSNITYGAIANNQYAITEFLLKESASGYDHYFRVELEKREN